jgi:hypothetical protein
MQAVIMSDTVKLELSDFLVAEIAVVDPTGAIVRVNRKWDETARVGSLSPKQSGWNYIEECEAAIKRNCAVAAKVLDGLHSVLKGESPFFIANYGKPTMRLPLPSFPKNCRRFMRSVVNASSPATLVGSRG